MFEEWTRNALDSRKPGLLGFLLSGLCDDWCRLDEVLAPYRACCAAEAWLTG